MNKESPENIRIVSREAFPAGRFKHPARWFQRKFVKVRFLCVDGPSSELMWVRTTHTKRGQIIGFLDNDPFNATYMRHGDEVTIRPHDVLDVQE